MIKEVSGDILLSKAQVIAHGVAPDDHFNQGLALSLREDYPAMAKDFRHYCHVSHPKPGEIWAWAGADGRRIVNLMTQEQAPSKNAKPGKATSHNVNVALRNLRHLIEQEGLGEKIICDSAGTSSYHVGSAPDRRMQAAGPPGIFWND